MYAAEKYMNNRVLSLVGTSVYNSRQFVVDNFGGLTETFNKTIRTDDKIIDDKQFNQYITNTGVAGNTALVQDAAIKTVSKIDTVNLNDDGTAVPK